MGTVIGILTISMALAKTSVATKMRRILPLVNRISGALLMLSGAYLAMYGWWEIQVFRNNITSNPFIDQFEEMQTQLNIWLSEAGEVRVGVGLLLIIGALILWGLWSDLSRNVRFGSAALLGGLWVAVEFIKEWNGERVNLFVLPILRTIVSIPERFGNWFTDPLRWGVLGELIVVTIIGLSLWFRVRRLRAAAAVAETRSDKLVDA